MAAYFIGLLPTSRKGNATIAFFGIDPIAATMLPEQHTRLLMVSLKAMTSFYLAKLGQEEDDGDHPVTPFNVGISTMESVPLPVNM